MTTVEKSVGNPLKKMHVMWACKKTVLALVLLLQWQMCQALSQTSTTKCTLMLMLSDVICCWFLLIFLKIIILYLQWRPSGLKIGIVFRWMSHFWEKILILEKIHRKCLWNKYFLCILYTPNDMLVKLILGHKYLPTFLHFSYWRLLLG